MKKVLVLIIALLFLTGFSYPVVLHARGGHGGGHGGGGGGRGGSHGGHGGHNSGFHGGHGSGSRVGGGYHGGSYAAYSSYGVSSYGWYGVGFFGGAYADPWYYYGAPYYDPYSDPYSVPLDSVYPDSPAMEEEEPADQMQGEWVLVPGQWVDGRWIPSHEAWVPNSP